MTTGDLKLAASTIPLEEFMNHCTTIFLIDLHIIILEENLISLNFFIRFTNLPFLLMITYPKSEFG